ncbi:alpha/beta hydrolase [Aspergillus candidus]|uniref:Alpha/beta-hydrolase n=1 Tax=Aspergillus candidus TaxID=41067 RepID=A0A2I2FKS0_ASPCN|nr:alpha/beta-hydrolase [Aspergillus candidus]PLB41235.1 alpha/beta-hydrolase [Aspergillus candidus]
MDQSEIKTPVVTTAAGYGLPYTLYLHSSAWLLRNLVALMSGKGELFDNNLYVDTPNLGGGRVKLSICIPNDSSPEEPKPLVLVTEGGGFVLGQPSDGEHLVRSLSDTLGAVIISIEYAKSPRYPYPHALLQLHAVLRWALSPAGSEAMGVAIDPSRVATMGNSAGGNLATALSLLISFTSGPCAQFREKLPEGFHLAAQVLLYPSTACNRPYQERFDACETRVQAASLPVWAASLMEASYLPPSAEKGSIFSSPVDATVPLLKSLAFLPPALVITAGMDCLKLEAKEYAAKLRQAGVAVVEHEYEDAIHGFSHYREDSKQYRKGDVEDCWKRVTPFLQDRFHVQT